jgi:hypothetical protein
MPASIASLALSGLCWSSLSKTSDFLIELSHSGYAAISKSAFWTSASEASMTTVDVLFSDMAQGYQFFAGILPFFIGSDIALAP